MTSLATQPSVEIKPTDDLTELLKRLTDQKPDAKAPQTVSKPSNTVAVRQGAKDALSGLERLLGAVELPSTRRQLTPAERAEAGKLVLEAKTAVEAVNAAVEAVREAVFNSFDVRLEELGATSGLKTDDKGHYLIKDEVFVPEINKRLTRELGEERPKITAEQLRSLYEAGEISRRDYFSATKHVDVPREVVDEDLLDLLKRKPNLIPKIAKVIKPGKVSARFYVRDPKKDDS